MYAAMNDLIARAARNQYAVLAINCFNLESARAAVKAAEEQRAPLILNVYQGHSRHFPPAVAVPLVQALAANASVPIALALDHGKAFPLIGQAFRAGFTGLMIDASSEPLAENIRQTAKVVEMAHTAGVCVEGELGHIADAPTYALADAAVKMTQVADVVPFLQQTGIDLLAVSVGTAQGSIPLASNRKSTLSVWLRCMGFRRFPWRCTAAAARQPTIFDASASTASPRLTLARRSLMQASRRSIRRLSSIPLLSCLICWR